MHVNPSESCTACVEKLGQCHNSIKLWFEIIADNFKDCHIAVGYRGEVDQEIAFHNGLSHARFGQSKHNYVENGQPCSWAIDVFRLGSDGKAYFEPSYMENLWGFIKKIQDDAGDQELYWGGLFTNLKDMDHFELLKVEVVQKIEALASGKC
jgi:hypothetical protein